MFKILAFIFGLSSPSIVEINYCKVNRDALSIDQNIEIAIGCSIVNGRRVYSNSRLRGIYEEE